MKFKSMPCSVWLPENARFGFQVLATAALFAMTVPVSAQKIGLTDPFDVPMPEISFGYTYFEGRYDTSGSIDFEGHERDELRLKQQVVGGRISQQFFSRFLLHLDAGIAENRLDGTRFENSPVYGGGLQVLLVPNREFYLKGIGQLMVHDTVELRGGDDTRMQIRNDWQVGFLVGREGDAQPLIGEEITGSRTYVGAVFSAREFEVHANQTETFQHTRLAGLVGLAGIQLDVGERFGFAVEGHLGAATGGSGWLYYRF